MKLRFSLIVLILAGALRMCAVEPDWTAFDRNVTAVMEKHHVPGVTLAIARNGKLAVARAYGVADREHNVATEPDSLFRIASISKTFTATAILKLVDEGRLTLDTKAFGLLDQLQPVHGQADPRLKDITIRQLLQHTGGWDTSVADPMSLGPEAARALNVAAPPSPDDLIRYAMGRPLAFDPGARFAYSNFGYEVLGRVIEKVTQMPYDDYVKTAILAPIGVHRMRLGETLLSRRAEGEVVYYDFPGAPLVWTTVRGGPPVVTAPYAMPQRDYDAAGGWIASVIDLVRFALAMDEGSGHELLLRPETLRQAREDRITAWPNWTPPGGKRLYGLGWFIDVAADGKETWWHSGGMPGTSSLMAHRPDRIVYAVLFNANPVYDVKRSGGAFGDMVSQGDAYQAIAAAIDSIQEWPEEDLFERYQ